jgi:P27 family predicted phage terminase small subunit
MKNAPKHLDKQARAKWAEVLPILNGRGNVDQGTLDALAAYCQAWSRWTAAEAQVNTLGAVVKSAAGFAVANPYVAIAAAAQRQMRQWAAELRLTPKTRDKANPESESAVSAILREIEGPAASEPKANRGMAAKEKDQ